MNVVFIQSDQHAREFCGCYQPTVRTPHIDSIAARGVRFTRAYCCSPLSAPARASLFAGRHVHELGVWDNATAWDGRPDGWLAHLARNGAAVTVIGRLDFREDCDLGVRDLRLAGLRGSWDITALFRDQPAVERRAIYYEYFFIKPRGHGGGPHTAEGEPSETAVTDEAIGWLRHDRPRDQPWLLYVGYANPHPKWHPDPDLFAHYLDQPQPLAPKYFQSAGELHPFDQHNSVYACAYHNNDAAMIHRMHAAYRAVVEEFDREVGRIITTLESEGILDDTLLIYTSDHGESARAHGNLGKCSMYNESLAIPLLMAGPGVPSGHIEQAAVSQLDLFPTIAHVMGLSSTSSFQGRSLLPLIVGDDNADDRLALSQFHGAPSNHAAFALCQGPWKYIHYVNERPVLFNLDDDPDEMHDLLRSGGVGAARRQAERLRQRLYAICSPEEADGHALRDQRQLRHAMTEAGTLLNEVHQRGYEKRTDRLVPWPWEMFDELYQVHC